MPIKTRRAEALVLLLPVLGMSAVAVALGQRRQQTERELGLFMSEASVNWRPTKLARDFDVDISLAVEYIGAKPKWWDKGVGGFLQNMRFVSPDGREHRLHSYGMSGARFDRERGCYVFQVTSDPPPAAFQKGRFEATAMLGTWNAGGFKKSGFLRFDIPVNLKPRA